MKILNEKPPIWEEANKKFKITKATIFAYGDTIYNPFNVKLTKDIIIHEETHSRQQKDNPEKWWKYYLEDKEYRLEQEIEAYANQYKYIKKTVKNKRIQFMYLKAFAETLSGPLYDNCIGLGKALIMIKENEK